MILNGKIKSSFFTSNINKNEQSYPSSKLKTSLSEKRKSTNIKIIKFISQKNKFRINEIFDEKSSKTFLDSIDKAMSEMHLSDELENKIDTSKNEENMKNKYMSGIINSEIKENYQKKKFKNVSKFRSTTKIKAPFINEKTSDTDKIKVNNTNKNVNIYNDSEDSNFIYKFIINNANDSEEVFLNKLKKEIKDEEKRRTNSRLSEKFFSKFSDSKVSKTVSKKKVGTRKSLFKGQNPFNFSENAKNLMINQNIEASSINSSSLNSPIKEHTRISEIEKNDIVDNNIFKEQESEAKKLNDSIKDIELDSDKESLINILSGLIQ